ncbi:MAG: hypothetical protein Ta2A_05890 [Treponemataceae bacterium]|nr:MAG: hypothetical protein Ta2A_05890 [Treponemataceae bacterium]
MFYLAKKNGRVYCHKSLEGLKTFGIAKAELEIPDEEFEAKGCIARLIDGKIFIGKTDEEVSAERKPTRSSEIESLLQQIDVKSGRAARAVALAIASGKTPEQSDVDRLDTLEAEAKALRAELKEL